MIRKTCPVWLALLITACASSSTPKYTPLEDSESKTALYQRLDGMRPPAMASQAALITVGGGEVKLTVHTNLSATGRFRMAGVDHLGVTVFKLECVDEKVDVLLDSPRFSATFLRNYLVPDLLAVLDPPPESECRLIEFDGRWTVLTYPCFDSQVLFFQEQKPGLNQFMRRRGTQTLSELELSPAPTADPGGPRDYHLQITSGFGGYTASIVIKPEVVSGD